MRIHISSLSPPSPHDLMIISFHPAATRIITLLLAPLLRIELDLPRTLILSLPLPPNQNGCMHVSGSDSPAHEF